MKQLLTKTTYVLCIFLCLMACKKDGNQPDKEEDKKAETPVNGGEIIRYSLVTIDVGNIALNKEEYQGKVGNINIMLVKSDDHELSFIPLENIPDGKQELLIPELNNLKIAYTVKDLVLTQSADATIAPLLGNFTRFANEWADTTASYAILLHNLHHVVEIYDNATADQQRIMAMTYQANKAMFDAVFTELADLRQSRVQRQSVVNSTSLMGGPNNLSMSIGRSGLKAGGIRSIKETVTSRQFILLNVWIHAARVSLRAFTLLWKTPPYWHGFLCAGATVAFIYAGMETAGLSINIPRHDIKVRFFDFFGNLFGSSHVPIRTVGLGVSGGLRASNNNAGTGTLVLYHDVVETVPFYLTGRRLQQSDRDASVSAVQTFFDGFDTFVGMINGVNEGLSWLNDRVSLANFALIPVSTIPVQSTEENIGVPTDILEYLSFSIDHQHIELVNVSLTEGDELHIKAKIVNSQEESIKGALKYVYKDDFSTFEGSIPIEVKKEELENFELKGIWKIFYYAVDGSHTQTSTIDFKSGSSDVGIRSENTIGEVVYVNNPPAADDYFLQSFNPQTQVLVVTNRHWGSSWGFNYDPASPNFLKGIGPQAGFTFEIVKQ